MSMSGHMTAQGQRAGLRTLAGQIAVVAGVPSIVSGEKFSVVDVAPGQVKIVAEDPAHYLIAAIANALEATAATGFFVKVLAVVATADETSATFGIYQADGVDGVLVDNVGFFFALMLKDYD